MKKEKQRMLYRITDNKFEAIDLFKFLMAISVISIHTNPFDKCENDIVNTIIMIIQQWSVPFFFVASGFFFRIENLKNYLIRIIKMYCLWTAISFPLSLYGYIIGGNTLLRNIFSYIKYFLFVGKLYNSYHLWYLLSLIYTLLIIGVLVKIDKKKWILPISIILYTLAQLMKVAIENEESINESVYNIVHLYEYIFNKGGIFTGMLFFVIGMSFAKYRYCLNKYVSILGICILDIMKVLLNIEIISEIVLIIEIILIFSFVLSIKLPKSNIYTVLRKLSTYMYLSHLLCYSIYTIAIIKQPNKLGLDSFVVTLCMSMTISSIIIMTKNKLPRDICV